MNIGIKENLLVKKIVYGRVTKEGNLKITVITGKREINVIAVVN